jgi:7-carboxy-7-deazaguanine synthase
VTLPVSEIFTSHQGEGPRAGRLCTFIRLGGCNLSCSWCDTPYTWDSTRYDLRLEFTPMEAEEIIAKAPDDVDEIVLTGGEPLMHQNNPEWEALLRLLHRRRKFICVETNGTIAPSLTTQTYVRHYSVSPKLPNAGEHKRRQDPTMAMWPYSMRGKEACLKFVVRDGKDIQAATEWADRLGWMRDSVWVMPEGTTEEEILRRWREIAPEAIEQRVNVTCRLQILAFGDTRGT